MLAYSNNGLSMRAVPPGYIAQAGEVLFADDTVPTPAQLAAAFPSFTALSAAKQVPAVLAQKRAAGIAISSTGTPALNATYPLDLETLMEIAAIEASLARGDGLPLGLATVTFHDINNAPVTFTQAQFVSWAIKIRDYFAGLKQSARAMAAGQPPNWPSASATIP